MAKRGLEYIRSPEKRRLDLLGAVVLALATFPAAVVVGAETMAEHHVLNPLFVRERIGRGGQPFKNYKFQSLRVRNAEAKLIGGSDHPDASRVGRFVRGSCLDELPQLYNVFKGDISLVGIRPVPQNFLEYYRTIADGGLYDEWYPWYIENPGLLGRGQLENNTHGIYDDEVIRHRMRIDISASENASLRTDLAVIRQTPPSILRAACRTLIGECVA